MSYWFVPMPVGHGYRPVTWQGWALFGALVLAEALILAALWLPLKGDEMPGPAALLVGVVLALAALLAFHVIARPRRGPRHG